MATVKFLEETVVFRPPGAAVPSTVALSHFDLFWLKLTAQRLFFYAVNDLSISHFTSSVVPALKSSLSLTLRHYFPLSGSLIVSSPPQKLPYIRCRDGDSVSVAVCESDMDFNHLSGDGARSLKQLKALVPKFPPPDKGEDTPLLAVQITVFPNSGFSIGLTYSHAAADGRAIVNFIKSWASICRTGEIDPNYLPVHSRDLIPDPDNKIATINVEVSLSLRRPPLQSILTETFRYTVVIGSEKVNEMKTWVTMKLIQDEVQDPPLRMSTFTVTCALIWVCLVQARQETCQTIDSDDDQTTIQKYFLFLADFRERLNLPGNYFGNCLRTGEAAATMAELVGDDGVYVAAKAIGKAISEIEEEGMKGVEGWRKRAAEILKSGQAITIAGSPKFRVYETDFGWGWPRKAEHAHIESSDSLAIAESRNSKIGAVEFGLVLTPLQFNRFNHAFHNRSNFINLT